MNEVIDEIFTEDNVKLLYNTHRKLYIVAQSRFIKGYSQFAVACELGLTKYQVYRLEKMAKNQIQLLLNS